eukprot:Clim_evm13s198 gene=Clim_evmTU13s198
MELRVYKESELPASLIDMLADRFHVTVRENQDTIGDLQTPQGLSVVYISQDHLSHVQDRWRQAHTKGELPKDFLDLIWSRERKQCFFHAVKKTPTDCRPTKIMLLIEISREKSKSKKGKMLGKMDMTTSSVFLRWLRRSIIDYRLGRTWALNEPVPPLNTRWMGLHMTTGANESTRLLSRFVKSEHIGIVQLIGPARKLSRNSADVEKTIKFLTTLPSIGQSRLQRLLTKTQQRKLSSLSQLSFDEVRDGLGDPAAARQFWQFLHGKPLPIKTNHEDVGA